MSALENCSARNMNNTASVLRVDKPTGLTLVPCREPPTAADVCNWAAEYILSWTRASSLLCREQTCICFTSFLTELHYSHMERWFRLLIGVPVCSCAHVQRHIISFTIFRNIPQSREHSSTPSKAVTKHVTMDVNSARSVLQMFYEKWIWQICLIWGIQRNVFEWHWMFTETHSDYIETLQGLFIFRTMFHLICQYRFSFKLQWSGVFTAKLLTRVWSTRLARLIQTHLFKDENLKKMSATNLYN